MCGEPKEEMPKFKVGDRVRVTDTGFKRYNGETGIIIGIDLTYCYPCRVKFDKHKNLLLWSKVELIKEATMSSKYEILKQRIEALNNGWDKDADNILQEIIGKKNGTPRLCICGGSLEGGNYETGIYIESFNWDFMKERSPVWSYNSQREKMTAFKSALTWLLEHSDIKKDIVDTEQKVEIEGKIYRAKILEAV